MTLLHLHSWSTLHLITVLQCKFHTAHQQSNTHTVLHTAIYRQFYIAEAILAPWRYLHNSPYTSTFKYRQYKLLYVNILVPFIKKLHLVTFHVCVNLSFWLTGRFTLSAWIHWHLVYNKEDKNRYVCCMCWCDLTSSLMRIRLCSSKSLRTHTHIHVHNEVSTLTLY